MIGVKSFSKSASQRGHVHDLMATGLPLFSIIITCFNKKKYIAEAISSALKQQFQSFEVIVIDDGSTDGSWRIIENIAINSAKIVCARHMYGQNLGASASRQLGVDLSRGHYLLHMDGDDKLKPGRLDHDAKVINRLSRCTSIISRTLYFHQDFTSETRLLCNEDHKIDLIAPYSDHLYGAYELFLLCVYDLKAKRADFKGLPCVGAITTRRDIAKSIPWERAVPCAEDIFYFANLAMESDIFYSSECLSEYRLTEQGAWFHAMANNTEAFWQDFTKRKIELLALDVDLKFLQDAEERLMKIRT